MSATDQLAQHPILVADDEQFSRSIIARMLRDLGCPEAHQAADGKEALDLLGKHARKIPLAILDFNMPEINGLQLLKMIRTGTAGVPNNLLVVMLTGSADQGLVGAALSLDVDAFLIKPVSKAMLSSRLQKVLSEPNETKSIEAYQDVDIAAICRGLLSRKPVGQPLATPKPAGGKLHGMRLKLEDVAEGSILAEDIRGPDNELLLGIGCMLSTRYLRRLKELGSVINTEYVTVHPPRKKT